MPYKKNTGRGLTKKQREEVKKIAEAPLERKAYPVSYQDQAITSIHLISEICDIPQGDTEESRDGDSIKITSLHFRGSVVAYDNTNVVRMTLIRWKPNGVPTAADIYETTTIGLNGAIYSPFNHRTRSSFVVIQDKFLTVQVVEGQIQKSFVLKCGAQPKTTYDGSATTGTNKLYLICSSDSLAPNHPTITMRGNVIYTDA